MSAHTPGPWHIRKGEWKIQILSEIHAPTDLVAEVSVYTQEGVGVTQEANARLIAAAPDLLKAVKLMQKACDEWAAEFTQKRRGMDWGVVNTAYYAAEKAIFKAEPPAKDGEGGKAT